MAIERPTMRHVQMPWGSNDLRPWNTTFDEGVRTGEVWHERTELAGQKPNLTLKLLFTKGDWYELTSGECDQSQSLRLENGKMTAWYILAARQGSRIAYGLNKDLDSRKLQEAIQNGSVWKLIQWHRVKKDDIIFIPPGTVHALGPGLVVAELQKRNNLQFRFFQQPHVVQLHPSDHCNDDTVVSITKWHAGSRKITASRALLISNAKFTVERIDLLANTTWRVNANAETWFLGLDGSAQIGSFIISSGEALYLEKENTSLTAGADGFTGLLTYSFPGPMADILGLLNSGSNEVSDADETVAKYRQPITSNIRSRSRKATA
jgi:mannose-6-phosphate isomerase